LSEFKLEYADIEEDRMNPNSSYLRGLSRRVLLSALAVAPAVIGPLSSTAASAQAADPLPSWNEGSTKQSILAFVSRVTRQGGPDFVPPAERIATFDNDGCLWIEQPMYVQLAFILDRVRALAPQNPGWKTTQPFKAVLDGDFKALAASGEKGLMELVAVTHAGMTADEFTRIVSVWLETARDHRFKRPYTELVYQPMLELLAYLRANGFKTFIVSGGGIEFMRPWAEKTYGIPPEQVVGSSIKTRFEMQDGRPVLFRLPEINFIDDKVGKPIGINQYIGRRPLAAFGNSDGDLEMLQWTTMASGPRLGLLVHHTDAEREYAYDRESHFGKLDKALDAAASNKWTVVDMKNDWKRIFPGA
jgi:phosphoserine phosphatase